MGDPCTWPAPWSSAGERACSEVLFLGLTLLIDPGWKDARSEVALLDRTMRGLDRRVGRFWRPLGAIGTGLGVIYGCVTIIALVAGILLGLG
jgi:hypothetical protein